MTELLPILAQPLAPDCIGLAILFLIVLAILHVFGSLSGHPAGHQHGRHHLHQMHRGLHELISHRCR